MTPSGRDHSPHVAESSRRARLRQRRKRLSMYVGALIATIVLGAGAVGAIAVLRDDKPAHASDPTTPVTGTDRVRAAVQGSQTATPVRSLDHDHPLKLWIGGDSLAGSFGPALGDLAGATGVTETQVDYKVSSGLAGNDIRNWYQRAQDQMKSANPEAVVFIIGTNDTSVVNKVDNNKDGTPDWQVDYGAKIDRMMETFVGATHRTVYWLGPPTLGTKSMNAGAAELNKLMQKEAAKFPDVTYIDTYNLFETPKGEYSRTIADENGKTITARIADGVHFSEDGADYLARAVFSLLDLRWKMQLQADTAEPIGWTLAKGSGEAVPGLSGAPRSRYRTSSPTTTKQTATTVHSTPTTETTHVTTVTSPPETTPETPTTVGG